MRKNKPFVIAAFAVLVFLFTVVSAFASKQSPPESSSQAPQTVTADNAVQPDPSSSLSDLVVTLEPNQRPRIQQTSYIPESSSESGISSTLDRLTGRIRNLATSFLGTPYRWGGTTPTAFDCSGFTRYVYSKLGVHIPRTAREQFKVGTPVKSGRWTTGDLVFFDMKKGYVSHVGMYLGGNTFIHASNPRTGVRIDNLCRGSYKKCYVGARRYEVG